MSELAVCRDGSTAVVVDGCTAVAPQSDACRRKLPSRRRRRRRHQQQCARPMLRLLSGHNRLARPLVQSVQRLTDRVYVEPARPRPRTLLPQLPN